MDFLKKRKLERRRAMALQGLSNIKVAAGLPPLRKAQAPAKLKPKYISNGPLADRLSRALARNVIRKKTTVTKPLAGRTRSPSFTRNTRVDRDSVVDDSRRRATWSQRVAWRDRVKKATPQDVAKRMDRQTCKERPLDSRKGGGGAKRLFVPWCKE